MAQQWYYGSEEQQVGPYSTAEFRKLFATGELSPETLVSCEGSGKWLPATHVKGLCAAGGVALGKKPSDKAAASPPPLEEAADEAPRKGRRKKKKAALGVIDTVVKVIIYLVAGFFGIAAFIILLALVLPMIQRARHGGMPPGNRIANGSMAFRTAPDETAYRQLEQRINELGHRLQTTPFLLRSPPTPSKELDEEVQKLLQVQRTFLAEIATTKQETFSVYIHSDGIVPNPEAEKNRKIIGLFMEDAQARWASLRQIARLRVLANQEKAIAEQIKQYNESIQAFQDKVRKLP